ncbi:peroxide stress protein YaaA [Lacticaseibacillus daqingensis]|uniref:peroxide stress protein YaaA n=1 Tax=Lacticaseibacillus daqingensis TaxID=2486014 RepID=UPI000F787BF5|nr:peroxide stress protein YaaA [Lacticaseibacillus daqingensis]
MQMIIAPAKKMVVDTEAFLPQSQPAYLPETTALLTYLRALSPVAAQTMWQCSDRLAATAYAQLQALTIAGPLTPAVMSYVGIQYQYMAPGLLTAPGLRYLQANLRILSAFYGILRPFDGIVPYRLEMKSRVPGLPTPDLYAFWGQRLHDALDFRAPVLNLASKEYAQAIRPYLQPGEQLIDVVFGRLVDGRVKTAATRAKMARGAMVRYLAEQAVTTLAQVAEFDAPDYVFAPERSDATRLVFLAR